MCFCDSLFHKLTFVCGIFGVGCDMYVCNGCKKAWKVQTGLSGIWKSVQLCVVERVISSR